MSIHMNVKRQSGAIAGEATDSKFTGQINVQKLFWGVRNAPTGVPGTHEFRKSQATSLSPFVVHKIPDRSTPDLFGACAEGEMLAEVVIVVTGRDKKKTNRCTYTLKDVVITGMTTEFDSKTLEEVEVVSFCYAMIEVQVTTLAGQPARQTFNARDNNN